VSRPLRSSRPWPARSHHASKPWWYSFWDRFGWDWISGGRREGSGVSPLRTLQAATSDNAKILKIDDRTGSIQPGLEADLLVVEGDPAENISDTRNIRYVFNNGKLVDRESLTRQWRN